MLYHAAQIAHEYYVSVVTQAKYVTLGEGDTNDS